MESNSSTDQAVEKTIVIKDISHSSPSSSSSSDEDELELSNTHKRSNAGKSKSDKSRKKVMLFDFYFTLKEANRICFLKRISIKTRLESIEENELSIVDSSESMKSSSSFIRCFQNFGVKSYLDDFYENKRNRKSSDCDDALYGQEYKY